MGIAAVGLMSMLVAVVQAPIGRAEPSPWTPFLGCWEEADAPRGQPLTCVLPVDGDPLAVDFVALRGNEEVRRSRLVADGTVREVSGADCRGSESTRFALDASRVYLQGEVTCGSEAATSTVAMFALSPEGRFIQVRGHRAADAPAVAFRVMESRPWSELPRAVQSALAGREEGARGGRDALARIALRDEAVVETVRSVGAPVTEIWLAAYTADAETALPVDERSRATFAAAQVPSRVVALLEALHDPMQYEIGLSERGAAVTHVGVGGDLAAERVMYRVAALGASSASGIPNFGVSGAGGSDSPACSALFGIHFGAVPGPYGGFNAVGARQMLLSNCLDPRVNTPEAWQAVYRAYPKAEPHPRKDRGDVQTPQPDPQPTAQPRPGSPRTPEATPTRERRPTASPDRAPARERTPQAPVGEPGAMRRP